jgi:hypothetical protein
MLVRVVTMGALVALAGCGDDTVPGNGDGPMTIDSSTIDSAPPGACDPVAQTCPTGQRCTLNHNVPTNTTFCEMGNGTNAALAPCTPNQSSDDCLRGTVCLAVNAQTRVCRKFCNIDTDCGNDICSIIIGNTIGPLHACAQRCMVLQQSTCTVQGEGCYLGLNNSMQPTQQCNTAGTKADGSECMISNDCLPGSLCLNLTTGDAMTGFHCHKSCNAGAATSCMANTTDCGASGTCCPISNQGGLGYCQ